MPDFDVSKDEAPEAFVKVPEDTTELRIMIMTWAPHHRVGYRIVPDAGIPGDWSEISLLCPGEKPHFRRGIGDFALSDLGLGTGQLVQFSFHPRPASVTLTFT